MEVILDTNAISDYALGNPDLLKHLRTSRKHSIPTVVLGEFRFGLIRSNVRDVLTQWLQTMEAEHEILTITSATSYFYAEIREELRAMGRPIPENDVWIAALAREHGLALLSRDGHFDVVKDIVRVSW